MKIGVWGLGFGVWGLGSGVWSLVFEVWGLGFGVWGLGFGVWGLVLLNEVTACFLLRHVTLLQRVHGPWRPGQLLEQIARAQKQRGRLW